MKSHLKFILILTLIFGFELSHAQVPTTVDGVQIRSLPSMPAPGQSVVISLESYRTDVNAASIIWLVDGKNYAQGVGLTSIQVTAPALGKTLVVLAVIKSVEGIEVRKTIGITAGSVDLVWESAGYTPPFYRGKALFAYENQIRVTAIPHLAGSNGVEIDPKTLVYKWTHNDRVIQDQSGYGKQTLVFQEELPREAIIKVEVNTPNGSQKGAATFTLNPGEPTITFYEEDALYGVMYNKSLVNRLSLLNPEVTIRAIPYNFNGPINTSALSYVWSINSLERRDLSTNQSVTLRTREGTEGSSDIALEIRHRNNILQGAKNSVSVLFSKKPQAF